MYKTLLKPLLFLLSPEKAHYFTVDLLKFTLSIPLINWLFRKTYEVNHPSLHRNFLGLDFKNPVGLAAGFDKDGKFYEAISALGFGFVEIGTVTPKPQDGNPKPRLFRLPKDQGLINRMGFNNEGIDAFVNRVKNRKASDVIIGGNIGKNKTTPNEQAADDYVICFEKLFPHVDYFVVNVSSPNTPNLRDLQEKAPLTNLLNLLQEKNHSKPKSKPILLKIAPDLTDGQLDDILDIVAATKIDGIIATNTTIARSPLQTDQEKIKSIGAGGLSGAPLVKRSTEVIQYLSNKSKGKLFIIGVGGINSAADAQEKIAAGASLIQIYSGMVYQGPSLVKSINKAFINNN